MSIQYDAQRIVHPYYLSFRRLNGGKVLLTNAAGGNIVVSGEIFDRFIHGGLPFDEMPVGLSEQGFVSETADRNIYREEILNRYFEGWKAPHVHIISLSAVCRLSCVYCCASASPVDRRRMNKETADRILDFIFSLDPEIYLIEFQGGEPLFTFPLLKYIVLKAKKKALGKKKQVFFSVVTNLWECDEEKFRFLTENNVTVCASLDGPRFVHDRNRPCSSAATGADLVNTGNVNVLHEDGSEEENVSRTMERICSPHGRASAWLKRFADYAARNNTEAPNAICTVTKHSLPYAREIVDEFLSCGLKRVQLGPVDPLGRAAAAWNTIGVSSDEFLDFYGRAVNYMLELNSRGIPVYEKAALAFAKQLHGTVRPRYQNLDILYRLAYNWDGGIYGSDEARMLSNSGDETFRLGSVYSDTFREIIRRPLAIRLVASALTELRQPMCSRCPSSLYCRVPPVYNYITQHSIAGNMAANERCRLYRSVYELLSSMNSDPCKYEIFRKWSEMYD